METVVLKDSITANMTNAEFFRFCQENPQLRIERNSHLQIVIMSPVSTLSSYSSGKAFAALSAWSELSNKGIAFDSSAGFTLPDKSVFSPDASWVSRTKWDILSDEDKNRFAPVVPEFVIEVRSKSDQVAALKEKMKLWIANGAELAWLIDPVEKRVIIFTLEEERVVEGFDNVLAGEGAVEGFRLDLSKLIL